MPKENIRDDVDSFIVRVGWEREGWVQVAVVTDTPVRMTFADSDGAIDSDGFYATLGRDGINRLIRSLRKARDQAYGQDA